MAGRHDDAPARIQDASYIVETPIAKSMKIKTQSQLELEGHVSVARARQSAHGSWNQAWWFSVVEVHFSDKYKSNIFLRGFSQKSPTTLPPIIMEVKHGPIVKETIVLDGPILHFHDYGRKS